MRYNEALKAHGLQVSSRTLRVAEIPADPSIAKRLELEIGDPVILFERLSLADEQPISIGSSYFPSQRFQDCWSVAKNVILFLNWFRRMGAIIFVAAPAFLPDRCSPEMLAYYHCRSMHLFS